MSRPDGRGRAAVSGDRQQPQRLQQRHRYSFCSAIVEASTDVRPQEGPISNTTMSTSSREPNVSTSATTPRRKGASTVGIGLSHATMFGISFGSEVIASCDFPDFF